MSKILTLFDIIIVSNALLEALIATFKVVAWSKTKTVCKITYTMVSKKWARTPMCSRFRPRGSVAVQNRASMVSWPKAENKRSPTWNFKIFISPFFSSDLVDFWRFFRVEKCRKQSRKYPVSNFATSKIFQSTYQSNFSGFKKK